MTWTDARIAQLTCMWSEGLSASRIAAALGGVSRSAVCGKVDRLGLTRTGGPRKARRARTAEPRQRTDRRASARPNAKPSARAVFVIPLAQRRTFMELTEDTCRWPVGDPAAPDFFFCGGQPVVGFPYCAHHRRLAYQPPADPPGAALPAGPGFAPCRVGRVAMRARSA